MTSSRTERVGCAFFQDPRAVGGERPLWVQFEVRRLDMQVPVFHFSLTRPRPDRGPGYRPHDN